LWSEVSLLLSSDPLVESRCLFELSACPLEMPADGSFVQADRLGYLFFAAPCSEEEDDPLFGERELGNRHNPPFLSTPGECVRGR